MAKDTAIASEFFINLAQLSVLQNECCLRLKFSDWYKKWMLFYRRNLTTLHNNLSLH